MYIFLIKEKRHVMKKTTSIIIVALLALSLLTGCTGLSYSDWFYDEFRKKQTEAPSSETEGPVETPTATNTPGATDTPADPTIAPTFKPSTDTETYTVSEIYANNVDSVVGITTSATTKNVWGQTSRTSCSGTGIVLTSDGYIMTNHHVVEGGTSFKVTLYNGDQYDATLVGSEEANDIAVLKIDAKNLKAVTLGDSDKIIVGEDLIVIGNPLGELTYTLTRGVVSALDRVINTSDVPINMFQVDAAINAGNSGGPAFDAHGHVIGVVTAKYASESIEGLGFCIPINDALNVANQLIQYGYVKGKPALGIAVTEAYSRSYWGFSQLVSGAYVSYVIDGFASSSAGIKEGMLINYLNDTTITSPGDLVSALRSYKAGERVTIKGYYNNDYFEKQVTLGEYSPSLIPDNWNQNNGTIV